MEFFKDTTIPDVILIRPELIRDNRGFFTRMFCTEELKKNGLEEDWPQCNSSYNHYKGTLRGMHFQMPPCQEAKLVSCISGAIYDVVVDLRKNSNTYCKWVGYTLDDVSKEILYVPKGFAHGYLTLEDMAEVFYHVSTPYNKNYEKGVLYNDPAFSIAWPIAPKIISDRDKNHPVFVA